jgi:hypothetical protein
MKLDRLFNVLVLGGAAIGLGGACGDDNDTGGGTTGSSGSTGTTASSSGSGTGSGTTAGSGGAGGTTSAGTGGGGGAGGQSAGSGGAGGALECPEVPGPDDPCGCPCCWVVDCLNTDGVCCATFCEDTCC